MEISCLGAGLAAILRPWAVLGEPLFGEEELDHER